MAGTNDSSACRLCGAHAPETGDRRLCVVCDEYTQLVALQSNQALERIVGEVQNGAMFRNASRRMH
jgi:hypothetical protein